MSAADRTDDAHYREQWALELTRANRLEHELRDARSALKAAADGSQNRLDLYTAGIGAEAALRREVARLQDVVVEQDGRLRDLQSERDHLHGLLSEHVSLARVETQECEECGGTGLDVPPLDWDEPRAPRHPAEALAVLLEAGWDAGDFDRCPAGDCFEGVTF